MTDTKACTCCGITKSLGEFYLARGYRLGVRSECKSCLRSKQANRESDSATRAARAARARESSKRGKAILDAAKSVPCMDCGVQYPPWVMDLDHRPGEVKIADPSQMKRRPPEVLIAEIAKCDPVCANCHRARTHERRVGA